MDCTVKRIMYFTYRAVEIHLVVNILAFGHLYEHISTVKFPSLMRPRGSASKASASSQNRHWRF